MLFVYKIKYKESASLWGSAFASGANTGQPGQELEGKARRVKKRKSESARRVLQDLVPKGAL